MRKISSLCCVLLSLLCIAWTWPPHWSPAGKKRVYTEQVLAEDMKSGIHAMWAIRYDDGTGVLYAYDHPLRPVAIDSNLEKTCAPTWIDYAISTPDGQTILPRDLWKNTSEWRLTQPLNPECRKEKKAA